MAAFFKRKGVWIVRVRGRGQITVGRNNREASAIASMIDRLEASAKHGLIPEPEVLLWVRKTSAKLRGRLVELGLVVDEKKPTIGDLIQKWDRMNRGKAATVRVKGNAAECCLEYFGTDREVESVTEADAEEYRQWLSESGRRNRRGEFIGEPLAPSTVSKRIKNTRRIFNLAKKSRWIPDNVFDEMKAGAEVNDKRLFFVSRETFYKVVENFTTAEDRLVFALARWAGMRTPSEPSALLWSDIDWHRRSMRFRCPKTEHIPRLAKRTCPIFPELMPYLEEAFENAADGELHACPKIATEANPAARLYKSLTEAIERAGLDPWPRRWNNLRATRATEIDDEFGAKAESEWIGHGSETALRSYLMVTDDKFDRATGRYSGSDPEFDRKRSEFGLMPS